MTDHFIFYPPVPPGCRYFNPRRLRRAARKLRQSRVQHEQKVAQGRFQLEQREVAAAAVKARLEQERASRSLLNRARARLSRFLGRRKQ